MAHTYLARYRKSRKFRAVFIGKNLVLSTAFFLMLLASLVMVFAVISIHTKPLKSAFNRNMITNTVTVIGAGVNDSFVLQTKRVVADFFGIKEIKDNFASIPVFYNVKTEITDVPAVKTSHGVIAPYVPIENVSDKTISTKNAKIKNETSYNIDLQALKDAPLEFDINSENPQILIVHTHGSESYTQSAKYNYSNSDYSRCQDLRYNVVRVGEELSKELKERGLKVVHDRTINDYPSYNNSYNKTLDVIEKNIEKYPSIKCVFDIHRDAIVDENNNKIKFSTQINGEKVSQIMIVCGTDQLGLPNPHWQKNLSLALKIQDYLDNAYPGLMRPVNLRKERFNMHKTTGSLIFEVGTHGNTLDEALASIKYLADGIENVLTK